MLKNLIHIVLFTFLILTLSCQPIQEEDQDPFLRLLNPNGGEIFNELDTVSITWTSGGEWLGSTFHPTYIQLYYSKDAGNNWNFITSDSAIDGAYSWTINSVTQTYDSCKVKIWVPYLYEDVSDGYFTIAADSTFYRILSPNGGETWDELSTQTITWESSGDVESVNDEVSLYYSLNSGQDWILIDISESNDGSYSWIIPEVYVTKAACRIRVKEKSIPHIEDISDADFTITAGSGQSDIMNVLSANGGEVWHEQTTQEIRWYTTGDIGGNDVSLAYSLNSGIAWSNISSSTPNDGSYDWTIPNFSDTLDQCIIGIWSAANTAFYDMSDNYFTITCDSNYYRILQPNGGETFQKETDRHIIWTSDGDVGPVKIYYSFFGGESWYLIDDYETNDGSFVWSVPSVQGTNDACKIKIQSRHRDDWFDISDANFTIADTVIFDFDMDFEGGEDISDWTFGGNWTIDTNDAYSGTGSAMSYDNGTYSMSTSMFTETGVLKFYYNEKFYSYSSYLILSIDDSAVATIGKTNNNGNWKIFEYYIEGGEHNFTWISENVGNPEYFYIRIDAISFP